MPAAKIDVSELLPPELMARLDRLDIVSRKIFAGKLKGERRSKRRGQSVEFADHRSYVVGDDLRFLDWNIYARLERLFIKLFLEEEDLHVRILIDTSRSMDWGDPNKGVYARRVAAALTYIGLVNYHRVSLFACADGLRGEAAGLRGRNRLHHAVNFLSNLTCDGASHLAASCRALAIRSAQPGIVLVLSDFFDKAGYEGGLRYLLRRDVDVYAVQVLAPDEIEPSLTGDLRLRDVEDDDLADVTISRALINRYKRNLEAYCEGLRDYCTRRGIHYLFTSTQVPFDQLVLGYLRHRGLLR